MNKKGLFIFLGFFLLLEGLSTVRGQGLEQQEAFIPMTMPTPSAYRSATGKPGPNYWQNEADYSIQVEVLPETHEVRGSVFITYTNNSPDYLHFVWLQLDQNLFKTKSRGALTTPLSGARFGNVGFEGGYTLENVQATKNGDELDISHIVEDTRMQIRFAQPLKPQGDRVTLSMDFSFKIPEYGSDRMGRMDFKKGTIYEFAQWYPRMAVYDDIDGWNVQPYLGAGEFYLEYGTFQVEITAPWNMTVLSAGTLLNPEEVLPEVVQERLGKALESDKTVAIIGKKEVGNKKFYPSKKGKLTWKFVLENARDFAFGASTAFIWDAAKINLPSGKTILAMSGYPEESIGNNGWERSTEFTKHSIELNSYWMEYPYPAAVNIAGIVGGMEYPGVSFCSWRSKGARLWGVTDHEFGHNWFPMIVGSNERRYPWMDEGFNSFINIYATQQFNEGEFSPRRNSATEMVPYLLAETTEASMTLPDMLQPFNLGNAFYYKPAMGLKMLREDILGQERFDYAFKEYIRRWKYKHPTPYDFFRTMEDVAGEDLDWFWKGWFLTTWTSDQQIKEVNYFENDPSNGSAVTIVNQGKMVFPVKAVVTELNGTEHRIDLPVEVWQRGNTWSFAVPSSSAITKVVLDPDGRFPDVDRTNNEMILLEKDESSLSDD